MNDKPTVKINILDSEEMKEFEDAARVYPRGFDAKLTQKTVQKWRSEPKWAIWEACLLLHDVEPRASQIYEFWDEYETNRLSDGEGPVQFVTILRIVAPDPQAVTRTFLRIGKVLLKNLEDGQGIYGTELVKSDLVLRTAKKDRLGKPEVLTLFSGRALGSMDGRTRRAQVRASEIEQFAIEVYKKNPEQFSYTTPKKRGKLNVAALAAAMEARNIEEDLGIDMLSDKHLLSLLRKFATQLGHLQF